jgi:hypothetical protein
VFNDQSQRAPGKAVVCIAVLTVYEVRRKKYFGKFAENALFRFFSVIVRDELGASQGRDLIMQITARSYLTSGIAALGAGAIAFSPIQPLPDHAAVAQERAVSNLAINLAASTIDPFTPWIQTFEQAAANIQVLGDFYNEDPTPILTTIGKNIITYGDYVMAGQGLKIPGLIANNITTFFQGPWWNAPNQPIPAFNNATPPAPIYSSNYISETQTVNRLGVIFNSQRGVYNVAAPLIASQLAPLLPENLAPLLPAILQFTATPYSGLVGGIVSPIVSSLVQLNASITAARNFFDTGDVIGGINEIINIPANTTNAFLNGLPGILDLTSQLLPLLPPALQGAIQRLGLQLSGFLTGPVPLNGSLTNANRPPTIFTGGTLFDLISARATLAGLGADTTGLKVGYYQAAIGLGQFLGQRMLVPPPTPGSGATAAAPKVAAAALPPPAAATTDPGAGSAPEVQAPKDNTPDTLDAPKALSQSDETEAPAPKRQTHRRAAAASSDSAAGDNDSDSGSHASRRHAG